MPKPKIKESKDRPQRKNKRSSKKKKKGIKIKIKNSLPQKRKVPLTAKVHAFFTLVSFLFYAGFGFFLGPEYLLKDVSNKYKALAATTTLSVRIIGPPEAAVLSAEAGCTETAPYVSLEWEATRDTDTYDLYRDGNILISGLDSPNYIDESVGTETSYTYQVVSIGSLGQAQSNESSATTGKCLATPTCQITSLGGINLLSHPEAPELEQRMPLLTGVTNLTNANIEINLLTGPIITGFTTANINGYWSWTFPQKLNFGSHTVLVTASDPSDPTRFSQDSQNFKIVREEEDDDEDEDDEDEEISKIISPPVPVSKPPVEVQELALSVEVTNSDNIVFTGENLYFTLKLEGKNGEKPQISQLPLAYQVYDSKNNLIVEIEESLSSEEAFLAKKNIRLPKSAQTGKYTLRVSVSLPDSNRYLSAEDSFILKDKPFLTAGNISITSTQALACLGWIWLLSLLFLLAYLFLFFFEHHLSRKAVFHITEEDLKREGYVQ